MKEHDQRALDLVRRELRGIEASLQCLNWALTRLNTPKNEPRPLPMSQDPALKDGQF